MYQLFNFPRTSNLGVVLNQQWTNIRKGLRRNLASVTEHYSSQSWVGRPETLLNKLILSIGELPELSDRDFYLHIQAKSNDVARALEMTNSSSRGKIHKYQFFGGGVQEILLSTPSSFTYRDLIPKWQALTPVTVVSHPLTDLQLPVLDGSATEGRGVAVIAIDIPLLLAQYRIFRQIERTDTSAGTLPPQGFIQTFVLPGMYKSYLDLALCNRLYKHWWDEPIAKSNTRHPIYVQDWSREVDDTQQWLCESLRKRNLRFVEILRQVPLVTHESALELSILPDFYRTRQINWALALARLDMIEWLFSVNYVSYGNPNGRDIHSVLRHIQQYNQSQQFSGLPRDIVSDIQSRIDRIRDLVK